MSIILKEVLSEALPIISKIAPGLGGVIGGPAGVAGGIALSLLSRAFNTSPSDFPGIVSGILNDPNAQDKLASLEKEHGSWLSSIAADMRAPTHVEVNIKMDWENPSSGM